MAEIIKICRDCKRPFEKYKEPFFIGKSPIPVEPYNSYYCKECMDKAIDDGYFFKDGQKTSRYIEQLCDEVEYYRLHHIAHSW